MAFSSFCDAAAALYLFSVAFASHLHFVFSLVCAVSQYLLRQVLETSPVSVKHGREQQKQQWPSILFLLSYLLSYSAV